jgi:hypothetical protein
MRGLALAALVCCLAAPACGANAVPAADRDYHVRIAKAAVGDLLRHYWVGDAATGHILETHGGYGGQHLPDPRGGLWERAMLVFALDSLYQVTRDPDLRRRIAADWKTTKSRFSAEELESCGTGINPACDDCGWSARLYLTAYRNTNGPDALDRAKGLVTNAFNRWADDALGGGLWYNDSRQLKSLYQVALALDSLEIWEATGDSAFKSRALSAYEWMEKRLLRPDGLYWCDCGAAGPVGAERPDDIHEAGSVSFLGGNMGMGVLHARLYRITGQELYRERALRTARAIRARQTDGKGALLDDRDAWTNGTFAGDWAREVLSLPGIGSEDVAAVENTARAIYERARTRDGFYSGCWNGPAEGPGCRWCVVGSRPRQITTSSSAVNVIVAGRCSLPRRLPPLGSSGPWSPSGAWGRVRRLLFAL